MPPNPPATDLASAVGYFQGVAVASFNAAYDDATASQPAIVDPPTTQSERAQKDWTTRTGKGKSQMSSAMQQLVQAETMLSDQRGRDGYTALVTLMTAVFTLMQTLVDWTTLPTTEPDRHNEITNRTALLGVLNTALEKLGQIAPVAVWQKSGANGA